MLAGCLLEDTCDNKHIAAGIIQNVVSPCFALRWCQARGFLAYSVVTWSSDLLTKHATAICILTPMLNCLNNTGKLLIEVEKNCCKQPPLLQKGKRGSMGVIASV